MSVINPGKIIGKSELQNSARINSFSQNTRGIVPDGQSKLYFGLPVAGRRANSNKKENIDSK